MINAANIKPRIFADCFKLSWVSWFIIASVGGLFIFRCWQRQRKLHHLATVMLRNLFAKFTHVTTVFRHANNLIAPRNKGAKANIFCQLPMPSDARGGAYYF